MNLLNYSPLIVDLWSDIGNNHGFQVNRNPYSRYYLLVNIPTNYIQTPRQKRESTTHNNMKWCKKMLNEALGSYIIDLQLSKTFLVLETRIGT